jgi:DNA end-binding protein Ku
MPASIWRGTISFGLVTIPVQLVSAVRSGSSPFHLLHDADHARLAQVMVCPAHGEPVPPEHRARGYEIESGQFVLVSDEELESVAPEASRSIEIEDFVDADAIDPVYVDRPYYLLPREEVGKPYRLLVRTLASTGRIGIGRLVLRGREHLAAIQALDGALCLITLHWPEAVRPRAELAPGADADADLATDMAKALDALNGDFALEKLANPMRERLDALIAEKRREAGTVEAPRPELPEAPSEQTGGEPDELMAALKRSLEKARARESEDESATPETASG